MNIDLIRNNTQIPVSYMPDKQKKSDLSDNNLHNNKPYQLQAYPKSYYNISFRSAKPYSYADDFLEKMTCSAKELIKKTIKTGIVIGEGGEGSVLAIPGAGMRQYLMKVPLYELDEIMKFKEDNFSKIELGLRNMNVGQPILELGPIKILLRLDGDDFNFRGKFTDEEAYRNRLNIASKVLPEKYDELANMIVELNTVGHSLDAEINNMFTIKNQAFCPMDLKFSSNQKDSCATILTTLVGSDRFIDNYLIFDKFTLKEKKCLKNIINKCFKACHKAKIPLESSKADNAYFRKVFKQADIKVNVKELVDKYNKSNNYKDFEEYIDNITQ